MREPSSSATERISVHGTRLNSVTLSTGPREAMAMFGNERVAVAAEELDDRDEADVEFARGQRSASRLGRSSVRSISGAKSVSRSMSGLVFR